MPLPSPILISYSFLSLISFIHSQNHMMKRVLFLFALLIGSFSVWAGQPGEPGNPTPEAATRFAIDEAQLEADFAGLSQLESFMLENGTRTYRELQAEQGDLLAELGSLDADSPLAPAFSVDQMDWGAFAWGFLCCVIGFFVVAINGSKDSYSKTSYWIGVLVSTILGGITSAISLAAQ
ncbi:MAG: hypothetical protein D6722_25295 [Bacteroidetes bacterium]|nr:MAG: hypothetical protein D6722_25295 [Bacteroidota bacterium]